VLHFPCSLSLRFFFCTSRPSKRLSILPYTLLLTAPAVTLFPNPYDDTHISHNEVLYCSPSRGRPRLCPGDDGHEPCAPGLVRPHDTYRKPPPQPNDASLLTNPTGRRWRTEACRDGHGGRAGLRTRVHHRKGRRHGHLRLHAEEPHGDAIDLRRALQEEGRRHGLWLHAQPGGQSRRHMEHDR
jgi:hypothetical protein